MTTRLSLFVFAGFLIFVSPIAVALVAPIHVKPGAISSPLKTNAVANGGQAQDEFSLLGIEMRSTAGGEQIALKYGDRFGHPLKGEPGYFQIALDHDGKRIAIDLSQVTRTGIEPAQLQKILAKSKFVASTDMTMDPHDLSTNLTLTLKSPVEIRVSTDVRSQAKVILDLKGTNP